MDSSQTTSRLTTVATPAREVFSTPKISLQNPIAHVHPATLIEAMMPLLQTAIWEAWSEPLELISINFGQCDRPAMGIDPTQTRPGALWTDNVYPPDHENLLAFMSKADSTNSQKPIEYRVIVGDGELLWVRHWILNSSVGPDGRRRLLGFITAIPEQKHLEWECLRVGERECNRIGQELHDDLCQVLAGLSFMMRVLGQRAAKQAPDLGKEIDELNTHVLGATDRVRSMAHGLFPAQLNYATLRHALKELVSQITARFPIQVTLDLPSKIPAHTPEQIIHIYRIAQEAVSNSLRHGNATATSIVLSPNGEKIQLVINDNGKGFPVSSARPEGIGMHVMNYRAKILEGALRFKNLPSGGASVELIYLSAVSSRPKPKKKARSS